MKHLCKKGTAILLALCVLALALGMPARSAPASGGGVRFVRVLLSTEGAGKLSIPVTGTYTLAESGRTFTGGTLTVSAGGAGVTVTHSAEGELYSGRSATVERAVLARSAGSLRIRVVSGTRSFLGNFTFSSSNGAVRVVNRVPLSHYLYGVVGYEMSNDFPLEALRAQAVAAKGYVLLRMSNSGSHDIGDTAGDQVYKGYVSTHTNVINAVDSTINDVLYYNGKPMQCYYAASNGGWMILPGTRWSDSSEDGAYNSGADAYDMKNPSTPRETVFLPTSYSQREMGTRAFAFVDARMSATVAQDGVIPPEFRFGGVRSIDAVESYGDAGSAADKNHTTVTVSATVVANLLETLIPTPTPAWEPTPSPTPEITPNPTATPEPELPTPTPELVAPVEGEEGYDPEWTEPTPTPEWELPTPTPEWAPTPSPTPAWEPTPSPTPEPELVREIPVSFSFTFAEMAAAGLYTTDSLRIYYAESAAGGHNLLHARYGHGVGMSQRGAQQMANEGRSYREILNYYYPGAQLGTMGFVSPETVSAPEQTTAATSASTGIVTGGTVNLRQTPSTKAESLEQLPAGTNLTLSGMQGEWYYVTAPSGSKGFIRYDYVLLTGGNMIAAGTVNASAVNCRTGPDTSFDAIGRLSRDAQVGIFGMENGWYKIMAVSTGAVGFVKGDYIAITKTLADNPDPGPTNAPVMTAVPEPLPDGATPTPIVIGAATPTPRPAGPPTPAPTATPAPIYAASGYINATRVNIRRGASTRTKSYGRLNKNTPLGIYEKSGSWYRVRVLASGQDGYVYGKYVSLHPADSGGAADGQVAAVSRGYINASGVRIRSGPGTGYDSLGKLGRNTTVTVLGTSGSWVHLEVRSSGTQGYVFGKYVTMTGTVRQDDTAGVITARLNLRAAPATGTGSRVLTVMEKGAVVTVHSTVNGWCYVTYNGTSGYCISSCVRRDA